MIVNGFSRAKNLINQSQNILLATHENPDADAIGSMLAMKIMLEKMDKKIRAFCPSLLPASLKFLPHALQVKNQLPRENPDLIIGLDYSQMARLGLNNSALNNQPFITFDHHPPTDHQGLLIINQLVSCTAEIIFHFLDFLKISISKDMATNLLAGIYWDTGGFRHPNTTRATLKITEQLLIKGASFNKIVKNLSKTDLVARHQSWSLGLNKFVFDRPSGLAYYFISYAEFSSLPPGQQQFSGFAELLNAIPEVELAALLTEEKPGLISGSLRSRQGKKIQAGRVARQFGGGGLPLAAGFQVSMPLEKIITTLKKVLSE